MSAPSLEDRCAILDLYARYSHATDTVDAVARASLFTDDARFDASAQVLRGRDEVLAARRPPNAADLRHWSGNVVIDIDGDVARATAYLTVIDTGASRDEAARIWVTGVYYDTLRKVDGEWKFAYRNFVRDDLRTTANARHRA